MKKDPATLRDVITRKTTRQVNRRDVYHFLRGNVENLMSSTHCFVTGRNITKRDAGCHNALTLYGHLKSEVF